MDREWVQRQIKFKGGREMIILKAVLCGIIMAGLVPPLAAWWSTQFGSSTAGWFIGAMSVSGLLYLVTVVIPLTR